MTNRLVLLTTASLLVACNSSEGDGSANVHLRVLETSDIHTHIVDYDYFQDKPSATMGLARTAALIAAARTEVSNSLLVDNGDLLQGNPLGDFVARHRGLTEGDIHPVYKAMNLLKYDVANIGNHEFNFGLDFLTRSIAGADFPYISSNVYHDGGENDGEPFFEPYVILDRSVVAVDGSTHSLRVGFIGFVPPQIMQWDMSNVAGRVTVKDIVETAKALVPKIKAEGADIVIAVPHSGFTTADREGMDENAVYYLSQVDGIDAILFGHNHGVFPGDSYAGRDGVDVADGTINDIPAVMPGFWGSHLGVVDLELQVSADGDWAVIDGRGSVRPIYAREGSDHIALVEPVAEIVAAVREEHLGTIEYVGTSVGELSAPLNSYFSLLRDDASIQIVTDAQRGYVERLLAGTQFDGLPVLSASAPFKSGGRSGFDYFTDISAGPIAIKHIADLYVYPNTLRAVRLDGNGVREWLEMSAGVFNQIDPTRTEEQELINRRFPSFNFDVIDGVTYRIDVTQAARYDSDGKLISPDNYRIRDLRFDGQPIDPDQDFIVATNNYRAGGGGGFPGLDGSNIVIEAPDTNRSVLADYILNKKVLHPRADNNWSFEPIDTDVSVTFISAAAAADTLSSESSIRLMRIDDNGAGRYEIRF